MIEIKDKVKLKRFIERRVVIGEYIVTNKDVHPNFYNQPNRYYRYVSIRCPCEKDNIQWSEEETDKEGNFNYWKPENIAYRLLEHVERKIRLRADKYHINLLIDLIGKDEAIILLERWAKKNMVVAIALNRFVENLKLNQFSKEE